MSEKQVVDAGSIYQQHSEKDRENLLHRLYLPNGRVVTFNEKGIRVSDIRYKTDNSGNPEWDKPLEDVMETEQAQENQNIYQRRNKNDRFRWISTICDYCKEEIEELLMDIAFEFFDGSKYGYMDEMVATEGEYEFNDFKRGNVMGFEDYFNQVGIYYLTIDVARTIDS